MEKKKLTKNALVFYFAAPFAQRNCSATSVERHLRDIDYLHFGIILG